MSRRVTNILGIALFLVLIAIAVNICDDRCSRNLSANEITWEEVRK